MKNQISLNVQCPYCLTSLMDNDNKLNGYPSIKLNIVTPKERGVLYICSLYECFDHSADIDIEDNTIVDFYCPNCNKQLQVKEECEICKAPMAYFVLNIGGRVNICSRKGCSNHYVSFNKLSTELTKFYNQFGD